MAPTRPPVRPDIRVEDVRLPDGTIPYEGPWESDFEREQWLIDTGEMDRIQESGRQAAERYNTPEAAEERRKRDERAEAWWQGFLRRERAVHERRMQESDARRRQAAVADPPQG